jgi:hypothetical protein
VSGLSKREEKKEEAYRRVKKRELKRFHRAVDAAIEGLLSQKYGAADDYQEYEEYAKACRRVKGNLGVVDLVTDRLSPLFAQETARTNWEVYLAGLRYLHRLFPDSHLFQAVLSTYRLEDLKGKLRAFSGHWLDFSHEADETLRQVDKYLGNLAEAREIMTGYSNENESLARLYASLKTWEKEEDFEKLFDDLRRFLDTGIEVFIVGPIQLYLMLNRDTFLLIFKALTVDKLSKLEEEDQGYDDAMALHDFVYGLVHDSQTRQVMQEVLEAAAAKYIENLKEEHTKLRQQVPSKERKRRFVQYFEEGTLFKGGAG